MKTFNNCYITSSRRSLMGPEFLEDTMPVKDSLEANTKSDEDIDTMKNGDIAVLSNSDLMNDKGISSRGATPDDGMNEDEDFVLRISEDEDDDTEPAKASKEIGEEPNSDAASKDQSTSKENSDASPTDTSSISSKTNPLNESSFPDDPKLGHSDLIDESLTGKYLINDLSLAMQPCSSLGTKCSAESTSKTCQDKTKVLNSNEDKSITNCKEDKSLSDVLDDIDQVLNECDPNQMNKSESSSNKSNEKDAKSVDNDSVKKEKETVEIKDEEHSSENEKVIDNNLLSDSTEKVSEITENEQNIVKTESATDMQAAEESKCEIEEEKANVKSELKSEEIEIVSDTDVLDPDSNDVSETQRSEKNEKTVPVENVLMEVDETDKEDAMEIDEEVLKDTILIESSRKIEDIKDDNEKDEDNTANENKVIVSDSNDDSSDAQNDTNKFKRIKISANTNEDECNKADMEDSKKTKPVIASKESSNVLKETDHSQVNDEKISASIEKTTDDKKKNEVNNDTDNDSQAKKDTDIDKDKNMKKRPLEEKTSISDAKRMKNDGSSDVHPTTTLESEDSTKSKTSETETKPRKTLLLKLLSILIENGDMKSETMDVEELMVTKVIEAIAQRSELSELRDKIIKQEAFCEQYRQKIVHLTKQLSDMDVVVERLTNELKTQDRPVIPVKITRSVGLQVTLAVAPPRRVGGNVPSPLASRNDERNNQINRKKIVRNTNPSPIKTTPNKTIVNGITKNVSNDSSNLLSKALQTKTGNTTGSPKPTAAGVAANKRPVTDNKPVIDLTDEDDNKKMAKVNATNVTTTVATTTSSSMIIPINSGNIIVAPQQLAVLTGSNGLQPNARVSYIMAPGTVVTSGPRPTVLIGNPSAAQQANAVNKTTGLVKPTPGMVINRPPFNAKSLSQLLPTPIAPNPLQNGIRPAMRNNVTRTSTPTYTNHRALTSGHPAPPPIVMDQPHMRGWKQIPPRPTLRIKESENGIQLSWSMPEMNVAVHEDIASYQIYAYQEQPGPPSTDLWRKVGDVKALPLPMACTLTSFQGGYQYYFAVRALDIHSRLSQFSYAQPISLNKLKS